MVSMAAPDASDAVVVLKGRITASNAAPIWQKAVATLTGRPGAPVRVDATHLEHIDDVGIALLFDLTHRERPAGAEVRVEGLAPKFAALIRGHNSGSLTQAVKSTRHAGTFEHLGRATMDQVAYASRFVGFVGRCTAAFASAVWR